MGSVAYAGGSGAACDGVCESQRGRQMTADPLGRCRRRRLFAESRASGGGGRSAVVSASESAANALPDGG